MIRAPRTCTPSAAQRAFSDAVDLFLGPEVGTVRLTQNTVLTLEKLDPAQTLLTLKEGSVVGWGAKVPPSSEYQVKLPNGIVGILEGKYDDDSVYPEQAFYMVGDIDEMKAKAAELTKTKK